MEINPALIGSDLFIFSIFFHFIPSIFFCISCFQKKKKNNKICRRFWHLKQKKNMKKTVVFHNFALPKSV